MKIESLRRLDGPNIYSYKPVLKVKLNIGEYDNIPSNEIDGFVDGLLRALPGIANHNCSRGYAGGFVERLIEGTYIGHIFEHVVLELQCMAGDEVGFGKTRYSGTAKIYDVVVAYKNVKVAEAAAYAACNLLIAVIKKQPFNVEEAINIIKSVGKNNELGPSTLAIYQAAIKRDIPVQQYRDESLLLLGQGCHSERIWATLTGRTSALAMDLASDKNLTNKILEDNGIPVPYGIVINQIEKVNEALKKIGNPVVIKPLCGNQGKGVTLNINNIAEGERAFQIASQYDKHVLVEEYIRGRQYRLCVVNGKVVAAAERIAPYIVGDGVQTINQLVDKINSHPSRGEGHEKILTKIKIDSVTVMVLAKQDLTLQSVPEKGQVVYLRENANLSTGSTAVDVTEVVHYENRAMAERVAKLIGLDVTGIDIVAEDISVPIEYGNGAVIEVNAAPGIRMHHYPSAGKPCNVADDIIEYLYPQGSNGRIPIVSVTGTNGKTTVTRITSYILNKAGYNVGMATTDGIYINEKCILKGDTTGPDSGKIVLNNTDVEVAVLETARGGILRGGLAFDKCDVGVVTNITEDHLGQDGIETLDDLAYVKSLVLEVVKPDGFAILNADDAYAVAMIENVKAELIYFSMEPDNILLRRHLGTGGRGFFIKNDAIYAAKGAFAQQIIHVRDIPITLGGLALHNLQNALITTAICSVLDIPLKYIRDGLNSFVENPGRLNIIPINTFRVCVDYGHNPAGYQALINTVQKLGAKRLVGVIATPGDRRNEAIKNIGRIAGSGFDYIYIKEDSDLRGRRVGETAELLKNGLLEVGFDDKKIVTIFSEKEAVASALRNAQEGDLIVVFYEKYDTVMHEINAMINGLKNNAESSKRNVENSNWHLEGAELASIQGVKNESLRVRG